MDIDVDSQNRQSQSWSELLCGYRELFNKAVRFRQSTMSKTWLALACGGIGLLIGFTAALASIAPQRRPVEELGWYARPDFHIVLAIGFFAVAGALFLRVFGQLSRSRDELYLAYSQLTMLTEAVSAHEEQLSVDEQQASREIDEVQHLALRLELDRSEQLLRIWKDRIPGLGTPETAGPGSRAKKRSIARRTPISKHGPASAPSPDSR